MELPAEGPLNNAETATQPMEPTTLSNGNETALDVSIGGSSDIDIVHRSRYCPILGNKQRQRFDICISC